MIPLNDNFLFFGVVEDNNDPAQQGRLRVRIVGAHTEDRSLLPTDALPWSAVGVPVNNASISGLGRSANGALPGTRVAGMFMDGAAKQQPLVLWSLPGRAAANKSSNIGFNDPSGTYPRANRSSDMNPLVGGTTGGATADNSPFLADRAANIAPPATVDTDVFAKPPEPVNMGDTPWMPIAIGEIGINEEKNGARVREYHKIGGGSAMAESVAWCASFVGFCLISAGMKGSRSAMARSYSNFGKEVDMKNIPYGSIVVMSGTRGPSSGHVVFYVGEADGGNFFCVGGNQTFDVNNKKKYDTGGQVTRGKFPKSKIVSVRFPTEKKT